MASTKKCQLLSFNLKGSRGLDLRSNRSPECHGGSPPNVCLAFLVFFIILFLCSAFLSHRSFELDKQFALYDNWATVPCTVVATEMDADRTLIRFNYELDGTRFTSTRLSWQPGYQLTVPERAEAAAQTQCYVNPVLPSDAYLLQVPSVNTWYLHSSLILSVVSLFGVFYNFYIMRKHRRCGRCF